MAGPSHSEMAIQSADNTPRLDGSHWPGFGTVPLGGWKVRSPNL